MKYIASCSFGKDSIAAILTHLEHSEPIDGIVYVRVMFDDETSAEYPEHEEFIHNVAIQKIERLTGAKVTILQSKCTYKDKFYQKYQKGKRIGRIQGYPIMRGNWCTALKTSALKDMRRLQVKEIVGIATDEYARIGKPSNKNKILPLVDHNVTELQATKICKAAGLLSPAYKLYQTPRLGCWFCHNSRITQLKNLRKRHPELWLKLLEIDEDSPTTFKPNKTLRDIDNRFANEDLQLKLF